MSAASHRPRQPPARSSAFLLAAVGCLGIAVQLALLRELMATYGGNELSAGVTLAAWLLCEALGAWLAGRLRLPAFSPLMLALAVILSLVAVPAAVLARPALGVLPGETFPIPVLLLATFAVVLLPAAAHGALFVTAAGLHARRATDTPLLASQGVGSAYFWEGIGTVLAALVFFLVLKRLPSLAVVAVFSAPLAAAALVFPAPRPSRLVSLLLFAVAVAALGLALPIERLAWSLAWRGQRVTAIANSSYGKTVRLERAGQRLVLYDGLPVLTMPPTQVERTEELSLLPVLCHPEPSRVLVLGSDLAIPAALARFLPDITVASIQLDPVLARIATTDISSGPPPIIADPVAYLKSSRETFDCVILTDAVPSCLGSSRLFSLEFFRLCRSRLAAGGLFAAAAPGNPTGLSPDLVNVISTRQRTLAAAFEHVLPLAADFPILLASDRRPEVPIESVLTRLTRLSQRPVLLDSSYASSLLDPFRQQAFASALELLPGRRSPEVSSAAAPRELFLNMVRENRLVSPAFGALYARLGGLSLHLLLVLGGALLLVGIAGARARGRSFGRGFAILTSGFSGAAASSLLIFAWQVRFGSVYSGLSLLVAAFMLGTVIGSILGTSGLWQRPSYRSLRPLIAADIVLALSAAAAALLVKGGPAGLFLIVNCTAGACLGFQFALAGSGPADTAARRAGVLTALDLAGGSVGGLLTALLLVPALGISTAALSAGAVKLVSALVHLTPARAPSPP
jgi:spermidine synthase